MSVTIISFLITLAVITSSGALAVLHKKKTTQDYLTASQEVPPWLSALSAVATNNSGFMFVGMIGYTYRRGIESIWMMLGWVLGDLAAWYVVHPRLRQISEESGLNTMSEILGIKDNTTQRPIVVASGLITLVFLSVYAAAQLKAGSTALHALLGWDMWIGVMIGTAIVILYSYAGGIRADIWTDAAQSFAMIAAMGMIMVTGYWEIGSIRALIDNLAGQDPALMDVFPDDLEFGLIPYMLGFACAGLGVTGQPHLMVRIMSIDSVRSIPRACAYYFSWYVPFFLLSIGVGLYARALLPGLPEHALAQEMNEPTELALPLLTMELLPQICVGIALAGLFAATVSTADSQIIVCSGALTHDVTRKWRDSYVASKLGTMIVTTFAVLVALFAPEGVFGLVLVAWSAMGASLGSVLFLRVMRRPYTSATALSMMATAIIAVTLWYPTGWDDDVLKVFPGMAAAAAAFGACWLIARIREKRSGS